MDDDDDDNDDDDDDDDINVFVRVQDGDGVTEIAVGADGFPFGEFYGSVYIIFLNANGRQVTFFIIIIISSSSRIIITWCFLVCAACGDAARRIVAQ
jgi:hypothetical protein